MKMQKFTFDNKLLTPISEYKKLFFSETTAEFDWILSIGDINEKFFKFVDSINVPKFYVFPDKITIKKLSIDKPKTKRNVYIEILGNENSLLDWYEYNDYRKNGFKKYQQKDFANLELIKTTRKEIKNIEKFLDIINLKNKRRGYLIFSDTYSSKALLDISESFANFNYIFFNEKLR